MTLDEAIAVLIPHNDDPSTLIIRAFFYAILGLENDKFVGFDIPSKAINIPTQADLKTIFDSYKGKTTKDGFQVKAFLASTFVIPSLQITQPSLEWQWIAKLCHLLLYFAHNNLTRRIIETAEEARKWLQPNSSYQSLWKQCYQEWQADTLEQTFKNIDSELSIYEQTNHPNLAKLKAIYRTVEFAYHHRSPIVRESRGTKERGKRRKKIVDEPVLQALPIDDIDDDGDTLIEVRDVEPTPNEIDAERERLDDNLPTFTILKQQDIKPTERYSPQQIQRRSKTKFSHANRNELFCLANIRHLPIFVVQNVCTKLWQYFDDDTFDREDKRAVAYLLLSLHTGYSVAQLSEDINQNSKNIVDVSNREKQFDFNLRLDITPLRIRQTGIESVLANRLLTMKLPLPPKLGAFLAYKGEPISERINDIIFRLKTALALPYLSLARIEKSFYTLLIHQITTSHIASIITGRNARKRADLYYGSHSQQQIFEAYKTAIQTLNSRSTADLTYFDEVNLPENFYIGSQNTPSYALVSKFFAHLHRKVRTTTNYRDKFNAYSLWLWHLSLLLTSIRAVTDVPGFLNQFNLTTGLAWIQDKEDRATTSSQRLVPLCDFLVTAIQDYLRYLSNFAKQFGRLNPQLNQQVKDILQSQRPLLNWLDNKDSMESLRPKSIQDRLEESFKFKADWTRHVGQKFLIEQKVDEAIISAIFGHEMVGQETWQKNSSMSIGDILSVKDTYQKLAIGLNLELV